MTSGERRCRAPAARVQVPRSHELHDLRENVADLTAQDGVGRAVVGRLLGVQDDELRAALQRISWEVGGGRNRQRGADGEKDVAVERCFLRALQVLRNEVLPEGNGRALLVIAAEAERLARFPASAALFLPDGAPVRAGATFRNPDLAAVLRRIAERGPAGFYEGETADLIVAEMRRGGGLITRADLAAYAAQWREPVVFDYRGHQVVSMPPPSSGGITLALIANILEGYDLAALGWHSPEALHLTAEAMRRAFADRNHFLGDPDYVEIPRAMLLSDAYAARQRATISRERATASAAIVPGLGAGGATGRDQEGDHTTHFGVVDADGNAVALTTTVNFLYGSAVTVAGAGFVLNDEMDDFTSKPGEPNAYGLVQGVANAIEPGKRMLSAMTPTVVAGPDGRVRLVTGARGGPRIITAVWQVLSNVVDHGMDVDDAVAAPRVHHQHLPDALQYEEGGLPADVVAALRALGHEVRPRGGVGNAPSLLRRDGLWTGVPDPRSGGLAAGY